MGQREDLLAGARICLAEKGYSRTTARDIAAVSGAHLASIGYHFGSKDNLMAVAVLQASDEWGDTIEAAVRAAGKASPAERLRVCMAELFAAIPRQRDLLVASMQAYTEAQFSAEVRGPLLESVERGRRELAAMVLGVDGGEVDDATVRGLGALVHALIVGYVQQALLSPESMPTADQVAGAVAVLANRR
ncbi:TetR/AcrR family transcriptional regulator [Actinomadura sp. WMMB 499]|uniref:TetR/AcrR family transcriptional regulator n=1 Tax=Actinomadura sp. WMMB 499 TaxID=1219491 RepID=UPI001243C223|nr:TetR/AcrR family transcriptional regulator [Actinomadura sp. WMMB 499]QFG23109.1 TetR/AcrR family transcriptional regulator [Actinomadura sp. WMMB 499]